MLMIESKNSYKSLLAAYRNIEHRLYILDDSIYPFRVTFQNLI